MDEILFTLRGGMSGGFASGVIRAGRIAKSIAGWLRRERKTKLGSGCIETEENRWERLRNFIGELVAHPPKSMAIAWLRVRSLSL